MVSQTRLEQLKSVLERDRKAIAAGRLRYVQLFKLKLLDEAKHDGLLLVELESLWTGRASASHIEAWLATVSKLEPRKLVDTAEARDERFAHWEAESAKHYLKRHKYLAASDAPNLSKTQLVSTPQPANGLPVKFATMASVQGQDTQASMVSGQLDFDSPVAVETKLVDSVKQAEVSVAKAAQSFSNALEKHTGAIEIVGSPQIRSKTSSIPTWMAASVLILAIATGSIASLLQYRVQSGGAYDPNFVSKQLAIDGLPVLAEFTLAPLGNEALQHKMSLGAINELKNATGRYLARFSESLLTIWCLAITCRILFDPLWRSVAMDSPLAAFGRLVTGMP